ncbi:MAG: TolC family protein [Gracilimonas sp.]
MKKLIILITLWILPAFLSAQNKLDSISLEYCYNQIERSYPLTQKIDLQNKITALNEQISRSGMYPEIQVNASASYQSDVTEVPFSAPGTTPTQFSKDHYKLSLDVSQVIYDGGKTQALRELEKGQGAAEDAGVKTDLWNIRRQTEQVYFGILMLQKKKESVELLIAEIENQLLMVQSRVENGVLLPSNALVLEAELLKIKQERMQVEYDLKASFEVLSEIIGTQISEDAKLMVPQSKVSIDETVSEINRPELDLLSKRRNTLLLQQKHSNSDKLPKISAFGTTAYGRPGLNVFEDDLQTYWIVGVKAQWSFRNWNNSGKRSEVLELQKKKLQYDEDSFLIGVKNEISKSVQKIEQLREQITLDEQVLKLRERITAEKQQQLDQGVITSTEYLTELTAENRAKLDLEIRKIQLAQAYIEYSTNKGNTWN